MMNNKHLLQSRQAKPSSYDIRSTRWFINTLKDSTWQIQESKFWKHKQEVTKEREKQNWEFTRGRCIQRAMSNVTNGCPALPVSANFSGNVCILLALPFHDQWLSHKIWVLQNNLALINLSRNEKRRNVMKFQVLFRHSKIGALFKSQSSKKSWIVEQCPNL